MNKIQALRFATTGIIFDRLYSGNIRKASRFVKGNVLDVGCGTKPYRSSFSCKSYTGVDIPAGEIKDSKYDVAANGNSLPFKDKSFDAAICLEVIEHVQEPGKIIEEIARVLKPNGFIILSAPQIIFVHGEPYDFFRFTEYGLEELVKSCGMRKITGAKTTGIFGSAGFLLVNAIFNVTNNRKTPANYIMKSVLLGLSFLAQLLFSFLDFLARYKGSTVNNMIVAKKTPAKMITAR